MKPLLAVAIGAIFASLVYAASPRKIDPLPSALSNNAVAVYREHHQDLVFSFMGIGAGKSWKDITNAAYALDLGTGKWSPVRPVPGTAGRIGSVAVTAREQIFLLGGYVVDGRGEEITLRDVNLYEPIGNRWYRGTDLPFPVDDSIAGVYRNRYIYVVSGWSNSDALKNVQVYDVEKDTWSQATPISGTPVFGHAGSVVGDTIVYVDGAYKNPAGKPKYIPSDECWMGKIQRGDPNKIEWTKLPPHPGSARFRIAAGASEKDDKIYFAGGTNNPYNYDGIGFDGIPAEPSPTSFAFNVRTGKWETLPDSPAATMDHRGLIAASNGLLVIGGMEKGQKVTAGVTILPKDAKSH